MTGIKLQETRGDQSPNISAGGNVEVHYQTSDSFFRAVLTYLPRYLTDLGLVFSGPKTFMAKRNAAAEQTFPDSLLFVGTSITLSALLQMPLLRPGISSLAFIGYHFAIIFLGVLLYSGVLCLGWRIVGGKAGLRSFLVTYSYFAGVVTIIVAFVILLATGVLKVFDPDLYSQLSQNNVAVNPRQSTASIAVVAIFGGGFLITTVWGFLGWGAFRKLNGLGRGRSFVALMLCGLLSYPALATLVFVASALSPTQPVAN